MGKIALILILCLTSTMVLSVVAVQPAGKGAGDAAVMCALDFCQLGTPFHTDSVQAPAIPPAIETIGCVLVPAAHLHDAVVVYAEPLHELLSPPPIV